MFDDGTDQGRVIAAALRLAETRPWGEVTLDNIAREAGLSLLSLRAVASGKAEILALLTRAIDDAVMRRISAPRAGADGHRDRLFDVVMTRLEAMAPHRKALKSITTALKSSPGGAPARSFLTSQYWMLAAAGINGDGIRGAARIAGLSAIYAQVLEVWLDDDDPGLAKTMAALDKRLRRAERTVSGVDGTVATVKRIACSLIPGFSRPGSPRNDRPADAPPESDGGFQAGGGGASGPAAGPAGY